MKYRKKPVEVEVLEWDGSNSVAMARFMGKPLDEITASPLNNALVIRTLEGKMTAKVGDFIIKGVHGEFYPCKPEIFEATYEPVSE